jgi:hypothetical protein
MHDDDVRIQKIILVRASPAHATLQQLLLYAHNWGNINNTVIYQFTVFHFMCTTPNTTRARNKRAHQPTPK